MNSFTNFVIFLLQFYVLETFFVKCDLTDYKRIDIKDIIKQKNVAQPKEYFILDQETPNNGILLPNTVNSRIKEIIKNLNNVEHLQNIEDNYIQDDGNVSEYAKSLPKNKYRSSSDTSNENFNKRTLQSKDKTLGSIYTSAKNNVNLRFGGTCNKGASKACVVACKGVLKKVCDEYRCKSDLKSRFKHECEKNCKKRFNVS